MTIALKITADRIAEVGDVKFMKSSFFIHGSVEAKRAGTIAKYFAIIPAMFAAIYPGLDALNIMRLHSPTSAILSAVIFNAVVIVALIPLALRGVRYKPSSAAAMLRRNLWIYGVGGVIVPFIGIKLIDLIIQFIPGIR